MEVLSGQDWLATPNLVRSTDGVLMDRKSCCMRVHGRRKPRGSHHRSNKVQSRRRMDVALGVARALVFLHHECFPSIVHRDVKASNVLLDKNGKARVTDFGLARVVDDGGSHVSTMVAGTVGYVAPEYGQTWQATTKGDVYSYGVLAMELATGRRAVDGGEECLVEWAKRVIGDGRVGFSRATIPVAVLVSGLADGAEKMSELLRIGIWCTAESPHCRPNMKEVLAMLFRVSCSGKDTTDGLMKFAPLRRACKLNLRTLLRLRYNHLAEITTVGKGCQTMSYKEHHLLLL
ncbi:hypothetical protein DH2020_043215 [Rehmannia glutinosa]|uniref:Protein kinase domain-containing protein n=1 Tax=Rehmannia glutinosa TaxID=99300 RepID=A0ABR0UL86_REHGL